jgi:hypothetical protein
MLRNKIILDLLVQKAKKEFEKSLDAEKVDKDLGFTLSLGNFPQKIELEFKLSNYSWEKYIEVFLTIDRAYYKSYLSTPVDGWVPLSEYVGVKVKPLHIPDSLIKYIERELEGDIISGLKEEIARWKKLREECRKTAEAQAKRPQYEFMHL